MADDSDHKARGPGNAEAVNQQNQVGFKRSRMERKVEEFRKDTKNHEPLFLECVDWARWQQGALDKSEIEEVVRNAIAENLGRLQDPAVAVRLAVRDLTRAIGKHVKRIKRLKQRETQFDTRAHGNRAQTPSNEPSWACTYERTRDVLREAMEGDENGKPYLSPREHDLLVTGMGLDQDGYSIIDERNIPSSEPALRKAQYRAKNKLRRAMARVATKRYHSSGDISEKSEYDDMVRRLTGGPPR